MLKHVGRVAKTNRRVVVAYRVVPDEPDNCIVVTTENLSADEHDALIKLVESEAGQQSEELATVMARTSLPDGRTMLPWFHQSGKLVKVSTSEVEMVPNRNTTIKLNELNELIAQQKGVTVADLAVTGPNKKVKVPDNEITKEDSVAAYSETAKPIAPIADAPLTDEQIAAKMRSDADRMYKEAKRLRDEAEELSPTKRTKKASSNVNDK